MQVRPFLPLSIVLAAALAACSSQPTAPDAAAAPPETAAPAAPPATGERLTYIVGCVNCHHQTPKEILNAPPLTVVKAYSLPEFRALLRTGQARGGRDLYAQGSIMGIVAREQLSHLTDAEVEAIHAFLQQQWTLERGAAEEAKIASFPPMNLKP
jgi:cytochrome c553